MSHIITTHYCPLINIHEYHNIYIYIYIYIYKLLKSDQFFKIV